MTQAVRQEQALPAPPRLGFSCQFSKRLGLATSNAERTPQHFRKGGSGSHHNIVVEVCPVHQGQPRNTCVLSEATEASR